MKTKTIITEMSHEDIVNLLSTAAFGSYMLGIDYNRKDYKALPNKDEDDCIEDKMAKLLLAGKSVVFADMYTEDEEDFYGELPHHYNTEDWRHPVMEYTITLQDIKNGLQKAADSEEDWYRECYNALVEEDSCNLDQPRAETLCQIIMFGKYLYD